jgi:hypothetical protein
MDIIKRNVYRVSYYVGGVAKQSFICAASEAEASDFLGVRDGTASVSTVASNVEVVGVDTVHDVLVPPIINVAPFDVQRQLTQDELTQIRALLPGQRTYVPAPDAPKFINGIGATVPNEFPGNQPPFTVGTNPAKEK